MGLYNKETEEGEDLKLLTTVDREESRESGLGFVWSLEPDGQMCMAIVDEEELCLSISKSDRGNYFPNMTAPSKPLGDNEYNTFTILRD